jgi:replicative DNA helicase
MLEEDSRDTLKPFACQYDGYPLHELIEDAYETIHNLHSKKVQITGYPTGFVDLDHITGGLQPGHLIVIASRPSMGKTTLAVNIAQNLSVKRNKKIATAIFSLEMSKEQLAMRIISATAGIDYGRAHTGHLKDSDLIKLNNAKELLIQSAIHIDDTPGININELLTKARRLKTDHNVGLIIIDYLQLMRDDSKPELGQEEISRISSALKTLARELTISIIVISQLRETLEKRKKTQRRPILSDLRGTGSLESDADVILFVYREAVYCKKCRRRDGSCSHNHERNAELIIAKQRNGPIGTVCLSYYGENLIFETLR